MAPTPIELSDVSQRTQIAAFAAGDNSGETSVPGDAFKTFTITFDSDGEFYVSFESYNIYIDDIAGPELAHFGPDMYYDKEDLTSQDLYQNKEYKFYIYVCNRGTRIAFPEEYSVRFVVDNEIEVNALNSTSAVFCDQSPLSYHEGAQCFLRLNKPGIHTAYVETEYNGIVNKFDPFEFTVLPEQGEAERTVSGYVAVDGIPQSNAEVALISEDDDKVGYYAVTDVHGYYNMPVIQHERMYTASINSDATFDPVVGIKLEAPKTVNFFIGESIVTGGTVHDENGEAVENAILEFEPAVDSETILFSNANFTAITDANGNWHIQSLPKGNYTLTVSHEDMHDYSHPTVFSADDNTEQTAITMRPKGGLTGIDEIGTDGELDSEKIIYNLQGIRVTNPKNGIYIINGQKVYVK